MLRSPIFGLFGLLAIAPFLMTSRADAQFMNYTPLEKLNVCGEDHFYGAKSDNAPAAVKETLKANGALSFRTCTDESGNLHFHLRNVPTLDGDLCRASEVEIFPAGRHSRVSPFPSSSISLTGWTISPPEKWTELGYKARSTALALFASGACQPASDYRYMDVKNISDTDLYAFLALWKHLPASPDAFDSAFANVEVVSPGPPGFWASHRLPDLKTAFRKAIFGEGVNLIRVECAEGKCTAAVAVPGIPSIVGERGIVNRWIEFKVIGHDVVLTRTGVFMMA
jgi:hypothetical protein